MLEMEVITTFTDHAADGDEVEAPKEEEEEEERATEALNEESGQEEEHNITSAETPGTTLLQHLHRKGESFLLVGVHLSYFVANFQFKGLISTLTSDLNLNLFHSVIITNVQEGAKPLLVILVVWLAEAYLGDCLTLIFSAMAYIIGMVMWYCAVFIFRDNWDKYGRSYFWGFLTVGLSLIILGQSGYDNYTKEKYIVEKINGSNNEEDKGNVNNNQDQGTEEEPLNTQDGKDQHVSFYTKTKNALKDLLVLLKNNWIHITGFVIAVFFIPEGQGEIFTIVGMMLVASIAFGFGKFFLYPCTEAMGSPLSAIFIVLWVAFKKSFDNNTGMQIYYGDSQQDNSYEDNQIIPSNRFGCLNKAAMYDTTSIENPETEFEKRRLCTIQQVEDTKVFIKCIFLSMVFLTYGVMTAVADTFFIEQTDKMNTKIGKFNVPIQVFIYTSEAIRKLVSSTCKWILAKKPEPEAPQKRFHGALRVGFGMLLAVPCFIIAAVVEDKKTSVLWLIPQLTLVAIMDGIVIDGVKDFFRQEMPNLIGLGMT